MAKKLQYIYISLDHETDGPCAGMNNMLTFGAAAFNASGAKLTTFYRRIIPLPWLAPNPDTMVWWRTQEAAAYKEAFDENLPGSFTTASQPRITAFDTMLDLQAWLNNIEKDNKPCRFIPMGWPAVFDFAFTNYYTHYFLCQNPLGYACLDIRSYIMGLVRASGYLSLREEHVTALFGAAPKNPTRTAHVAVDEAIYQGELFFYIKNHALASPGLLAEEARILS